MQQHPVPQNISSYQFRLIGDMTLKQFLELAAGIGIGLLFYTTNLIFPIKWFFVLISVIGGVAFAFMPLEGMPLDRWLIAFIKASYRPNQFVWKKSTAIPSYLKSSATKSKTDDQAQVSPTTNVPQDQESHRINQLVNLFDSQPPAREPSSPSPTTTSPTITADKAPSPKVKPKSDDAFSPTFKVIPLESVKISHPEEELTNQEVIKTQEVQPTPNQDIDVSKPIDQAATVVGTTNANLPFPSLPENPNVIVGMVLDQNGKIVENAIIEISDQSGIPVRATKTNKLGQFFSVTPLPNGYYTINTEKSGLTFDIISVTLAGEIYPPLEIRAKNAIN
jgi:hypothetical protein